MSEGGEKGGRCCGEEGEVGRKVLWGGSWGGEEGVVGRKVMWGGR